MKRPFSYLIVVSYFCLLAVISCDGPREIQVVNPEYTYSYNSWRDYLGGPDRNHYSILDQFTQENVDQLQVAWTYNTPDTGQMQMNPIIVDGILFGISAGLQVFALDAYSGHEIWNQGDPEKAWHSTSRGVSYWEDGEDKRILFTRGAELIALNALTGDLIMDFGDSGRVDLHTGFPYSESDKFIISNTPGTVFEDLIILPVRVSEGPDAAPGDVRAFNVRTGELAWTFHTIPHPGEYGHHTWKDKKAHESQVIGGANNWAGMAVDPEYGIVYVPTGSTSPDFYGGARIGDNLFANSLLALNARSGERIWHFQFVHHDLWDRDLPAPPNLLTVKRNSEEIQAVAQITKQGYVFVFDRLTGEPLFEIEEMSVPASDIYGEQASLTQPIPLLPKPFARQPHQLAISPYTSKSDSLSEMLENYIKTPFHPPGLKPLLLFPGYDGGAEWGGAAADPSDGILYVNSNEMAWELGLDVAFSAEEASLGESLYKTHCAVCHQNDKSGSELSGYPSLIGISDRFSRDEIDVQIKNGKGRMIGFPQLSDEEVNTIIDFVTGVEKMEVVSESTTPMAPYTHSGYKKFFDENGLPAIDPPWGTMHAIDLNSGEFLWSIPLGETISLRNQGYPTTGTENYGGPVVTENGLLFISATKDGYFRAFNKHTGELLWEVELPAAAFMTPSMYKVNGKQFIVVACGGEKLGTPPGNSIVAFSLPAN